MRHNPVAVVSILTALTVACAAPLPTTPPVATQEAPAVTPPPPLPPPPAATARYRVTFQSTWSRETHPEDWPADAHYSGLIGGTHNGSVMFWEAGQLASPGIQAMAEQGRKSPLDQEVMAAITAGTAQHVLSGDALSDSPGTVTLDFEIGVDFPRVTLVTMVAPSPDWFVGVSGLSLLEDGQWATERRVEVVAWDAGTDSGTTYESANEKSLPHVVIHRLMGRPVASGGTVAPFGTFTFTRQQCP